MGDQSDQDENALENWNKEEKYNLLMALKRFHSHNIMNIKTFIPTKTPEEITAAVSYYKEKAKEHREIQNNVNFAKITKLRPDSRVPLASWASFLTDSYSFQDLQTDTATAIRLIADVENIPPAFETQDIDFRHIYHQIANAMEGKRLFANKQIKPVLRKCIIDTALTSRSYMNNSKLKMLLKSLDIDQVESRIGFPSHSDDTELALLRQLAMQRAYNPLNIPELYFKPSVPIKPMPQY